MLDRQRSKVSVGNQVAMHTRRSDKPPENLGMALRWCGHPHGPAA